MARFSVGGDENGEGPSAKRIRTDPGGSNFVEEDEQAVVEQDDEEFEEEEEEEDEDEEEEEEENYYSEEDDDDDEDEDEEQDCIDGGDRIEESQRENVSNLAPAAAGNRVSNCEPLSVTLTDPDVLDCDICCEPLKVPVFQCENGHIACSACCSRLSNKCPACSLPIGYNRCRAIEKVLEAVKVSCSNSCYGCSETISYNDKHLHEKACTFSPYTCPISSCNFINSSQMLYDHFKTAHSKTASTFCYYKEYHVTLNYSSKFRFLQAKKDGILFVIHNKHEETGNILSISCISPHRKFLCKLRVKNQNSTLSFVSIAKNIQALASNNPLSHNYLMVPSGFCKSTSHLDLTFCVRPEST